MRLDGHTALITGGTQGVGAAIAMRLAAAGCDLVLHGLEESEHSRATLAACRAHGRSADCVFVDLAQPTPTGVADLMEQVNQVLQRSDRELTLLVNNAGTYCDLPFLEMDVETFHKTMQLNVYSAYFLAQALARHWIAGGVEGRIVFTGSINGNLAEADHTAYDTSKGAVHSMVRTLCVALAPHRIRVNGMAPGLVKTPLTSPVLDSNPAVLEWMRLHTPNGQVPGPDACAAAVLFLLSDEAYHVQGHMLFVDGGMSAWQQPDLPSS